MNLSMCSCTHCPQMQDNRLPFTRVPVDKVTAVMQQFVLERQRLDEEEAETGTGDKGGDKKKGGKKGGDKGGSRR